MDDVPLGTFTVTVQPNQNPDCVVDWFSWPQCTDPHALPGLSLLERIVRSLEDGEEHL